MVYAMLVRDIRADPAVRHRLDAILAGEVVLDSGDPMTPSGPPPPIDPEQARQRMEAMRDSWGATPDAAAGKNSVDEMLRRFS